MNKADIVFEKLALLPLAAALTAAATLAMPSIAKGAKRLIYGRRIKKLNFPINLSRKRLRMPSYRTPTPVVHSKISDKARTAFNANYGI